MLDDYDQPNPAPPAGPGTTTPGRDALRESQLARMRLCHISGHAFRLTSSDAPIFPGPDAEAEFARRWDGLAARLDDATEGVGRCAG